MAGMAKEKTYRMFVADFETTVYQGQVNTEVWAAAIVELGSEDVLVFHSINELYEYMKSLKCNIRCYFHNLKFDGSFWLLQTLNIHKPLRNGQMKKVGITSNGLKKNA